MSSISVILVHLGQHENKYLETCVKQIRKYNFQCPIYLGVNSQENMERYSYLQAKYTPLTVLFPEESADHVEFKKQSKLDMSSRDGFWRYCTERFYVIDEILKQYDLKNVFHLENDNLIYGSFSEIIDSFKYIPIGCTFDNKKRGIPGFMFISNKESYRSLLNVFKQNNNSTKNDMDVLHLARQTYPDIIIELPLIPDQKNNFPCIFDAAALGQFIGGIDPRNDPGNTIGYVNPDADYRVDTWNLEWVQGVPYANNKKIFNLHIHSKDLERWANVE